MSSVVIPPPHQTQQLSPDVTFAEPKKRAFALLLAAAVVLAGIYFVQLFHLLDKPLFSKVYYGMITEVIYSICAVVFWAFFLAVLCYLLRKHLGIRLLARRNEAIPIPRVLIIFAICILTVFITSACLQFKLLITYELGEKVSGAYLSVQIAVYVRNAVQLLLAVAFMSLVQQGVDTLLPAKRTLPYGGVALLITYGIIEFFTAGQTFPAVYLAFTAVFGAIFYVSENRLLSTFWASLIILIL